MTITFAVENPKIGEQIAYACAESKHNGGYKRIAKTEPLLTACRAARRIRGLAFVGDYIYVYIGRKLTQAIDYALFEKSRAYPGFVLSLSLLRPETRAYSAMTAAASSP